MSCTVCDRDVPIENTETGLCATCNRDARNDSDLYPIARSMFLKMMVNREVLCPVTQTPITMDSDVHHRKGRIGYGSLEKRAAHITLLIDMDYFLAVSREGHTYIENHPEEARIKGWTLSRHQIE